MSTAKIPPMRLSGLEPCNISAHVGFVNVGERTNVTGSKAFARMILKVNMTRLCQLRGSRLRMVPK